MYTILPRHGWLQDINIDWINFPLFTVNETEGSATEESVSEYDLNK